MCGKSYQNSRLTSLSCIVLPILLQAASCRFGFFELVTQCAESHRSMLNPFLYVKDVWPCFPLPNPGQNFGALNKNLLLSWLSPSLSDRFQAVGISGRFSQPRAITSRFTQGSVLCTLPLLLYATEIFKVIRRDTLFLFDDDIKIVYSFETGSFGSMLAPINEDLESVGNPCSKWLIKFPADNSSLIIYKCHAFWSPSS